jgi:hypothetical protein
MKKACGWTGTFATIHGPAMVTVHSETKQGAVKILEDIVSLFGCKRIDPDFIIKTETVPEGYGVLEGMDRVDWSKAKAVGQRELS